MELEEADCLVLWCLKQPGYFLSSDCSLLMFKHKVNTRLMDVTEHKRAAYDTQEPRMTIYVMATYVTFQIHFSVFYFITSPMLMY